MLNRQQVDDTGVPRTTRIVQIFKKRRNSRFSCAGRRRVTLVCPSHCSTAVAQTKHSCCRTSLARGPPGRELRLRRGSKHSHPEPGWGGLEGVSRAPGQWALKDNDFSGQHCLVPTVTSSPSSPGQASREGWKRVATGLVLGFWALPPPEGPVGLPSPCSRSPAWALGRRLPP